ncbi:MAG TPA: N-acetylmuramoyl-L-alanine amidase [Thermoanaerobaculia bacterium]|nr:N-acetylmuramoyl-L-alanine amidase [Thermoanaerobaculia bacterium]
MRRSPAAAALLLVAPLLLAQAPASFQPPSGSSLPLRVEEAEGRVFAAVADVVVAFEGTVAFDERTRSFEVTVKGRTAVFGTDAPVAVVDTKLVSLSAPARARGALAFGDAEFLSRVLGPLTGLSFTWDAGRRTLMAARPETPEITVEATVADVGDTTKVVFRFSRPPQYRVEKTHDAVVLKFPGVSLLPGAPEKLSDSPLVVRVNIRGTEAVVTLREKGLATNVYPLGAPPRLVVDVTRASASSSSSVLTPAPASRVRTVVLDPGHGGAEEGARGPAGLFEKDATLALAKTVQDVLTRRGYRTVLTRSSDTGVGLEDRAASANAAKADVFVSLHANASRAPNAHGTEVFYLSLDASDRAAALLAESENRAGDSPTPSAEKNAAARDLDLILWDLAQNQHLGASARLAEIIQSDFNRLLGVTTRGVKQAPFRVLIGVNAPAVLVEVAFITNPDEERKLGAEEFRRQTAETLAGSLDAFFRTATAVPPVPYAPKAPGTP